MKEMVDESRAAATLVILRDRSSAPPEILMVERASGMAFAAGAFVFPGGAVDESDLLLARAIGGRLELDEAAARIAAIRETLEESGLAIGFSRPVESEEAAAMRGRLAAGAALAEVLEGHGLELALDDFIPFARWRPATHENIRRIFDTRFYLARAPEGQEASVDTTENVQLFWSSAADTLARCVAGNGHVIYPTRCNLERLAQFACFDDLAAHARAIPVERVTPWVEDRAGTPHLCIPGHLGYPVTSEPLGDIRRG